MKHSRITIEREYLNKIRNKSFIIMIFVSPLIVVAFVLIVSFLTDVNNESNAKDILIPDESGLFSNTFSDTETVHYEYLKDKTLQEARAEVLETSKYGLLYIPKEETVQKVFYSEESPSLSLVNELTGALGKTLFQYNLTQKGIDKAEIDSARTKITLQMESFTGEKISEFDNVMRIAMGGVAGYLIFMFIIIYGNMIMRSVIEERTNRIIEIIISSVKPFQLILDKITGTSLAGIIQFVIWLAIGGVLSALAPPLFQVGTPTATQAMVATESHSKISNIIAAPYHFPSLETSGVFLLFLVGGYLLYSLLCAMAGAMVDNKTDTQQFLMPILIPLMLASYTGMSSVIEELHGMISVVLSYIPLTLPIVMLMRIPFEVAWWEVLIPLLLFCITFFLVIKIAPEIYRIGILMYGKKPIYKEVWKWLEMN